MFCRGNELQNKMVEDVVRLLCHMTQIVREMTVKATHLCLVFLFGLINSRDRDCHQSWQYEADERTHCSTGNRQHKLHYIDHHHRSQMINPS